MSNLFKNFNAAGKLMRLLQKLDVINSTDGSVYTNRFLIISSKGSLYGKEK